MNITADISGVNITSDSCEVNITAAKRRLDPMADSWGAGSLVTMADNWSGHYSRQLCNGQCRH